MARGAFEEGKAKTGVETMSLSVQRLAGEMANASTSMLLLSME